MVVQIQLQDKDHRCSLIFKFKPFSSKPLQNVVFYHYALTEYLIIYTAYQL